uniref:Uncharacterized protein n=1 Tax=Macrostomum lignano TaxID=282301 RepID=A0A1I8FQR1_9PLAT
MKDDGHASPTLLRPAAVWQLAAGDIHTLRWNTEDIPRRKEDLTGTSTKEAGGSFLCFKFAGKDGSHRDKVHKRPYLEWNENCASGLQFPVMDRSDTQDDIIGNQLHRTYRSSAAQGDTRRTQRWSRFVYHAYLPHGSGPCFVNFYGSPRANSPNSATNTISLNEGKGEGRRLSAEPMLSRSELKTELGETPEQSKEEIRQRPAAERCRSSFAPEKYRLHAASPAPTCTEWEPGQRSSQRARPQTCSRWPRKNELKNIRRAASKTAAERVHLGFERGTCQRGRQFELGSLEISQIRAIAICECCFSKNEDFCGKFCGKVQNVQFKREPRATCQSWPRLTENEWFIIKWMKNGPGRPARSDASSASSSRSSKREAEPAARLEVGTKDWYVSPELSLFYDKDAPGTRNSLRTFYT